MLTVYVLILFNLRRAIDILCPVYKMIFGIEIRVRMRVFSNENGLPKAARKFACANFKVLFSG